MSQAAVEQVIGKMLLDVDFRQLMASNISQALEGFDLTEGEVEAFKNMDLEDLQQSFTSLDERVSKDYGIN